MPYPVRPPIPNPYQIAGQAAQELGGQVQQFGKDRDELAERFRLMMEKRAQAELQRQQLTAEQDLKQANEKRQQTEFETKQKAEEAKQKFLQDFTGADPADSANQIKLKEALTSGIIDAATFKALQPKDPERFSAGGGYYEMGPDGKPKTIVAPRDDRPPRGQVVQDGNGNFVVVDPTTGRATPVSGADGSPLVGKTPGQLTGKQLENARGKLQTIALLRTQLDNLKTAFKNAKGPLAGPVTGRIPSPANEKFNAAKAALYTTVRQLSRTPGEGSMSDYESRLSTAQLPDITDYEDVTQQKIDQLEDLANTIESGYKNMGATYNAPPPGIAKPDGNPGAQPGLTQIKNAAEYNALPKGPYLDPSGVKRIKK